MSAKIKLVVFAVTLILISASACSAFAEQTAKKHHRHIARWSDQPPAQPRGCPVRQLADGSPVDCHGWRKWSGYIGWDNRCFNLDYLPSQFACGTNGGGW